MHRTRKALELALLAVCLLAWPASSADLLVDVEAAYAARQLPRTTFDPAEARGLPAVETRFLRELFALTDEAVWLDTNVVLWFRTDGTRGLHVVDYLARMDEVRRRVGQLEAPARAEAVQRFVTEALGLQRTFFTQWHEAEASGRPFVSQLTDEHAYHEGLHRSQRLLLKAYAELRGLYPEAGDAVHAAFHDHLRAVSLQ